MTQGVKLDRDRNIWVKYRPAGGNSEDKYSIYYLKDSNVVGNTSGNIMCLFAGQPFVGQPGYSASTIEAGNYFLTVFSAETTIGNANISCSFFGQAHTIGSGNYYCSYFGSLNSIGSMNYNLTLTGSSNTVGNSCNNILVSGSANNLGSTILATSVLGDGNIIASGASFNHILGDSNTINSSSSYNFVIGQSNKIDNASNYNIIIGFGNDFVTNDVDSINYNHILSHSCIFNDGIDGTFQYNFICGTTHSFESANIQYNFIAGDSHLVTGGNGAKYNAVFGHKNYILGSIGQYYGQYGLTTGRYAKNNKFACHVNSGGHPSLSTVPVGDMDEDCGAGQNVGMIPHSGLASGAGYRPIYMNGATEGQVYELEENKCTLLVTYVVASADLGQRTRGWRIETLANRAVGGPATIVSSTVTPLGTTSEGGESAWQVRHTASSGFIYLEVDPGSAMPVMWQAYGLGPEVISTEEYLS